MSVRIKAGTNFALPVKIEDADFPRISGIEFMFKQAESGETLKSAYWSRDGLSRDASKKDGDDNIIIVTFSREDSYLFTQDEMFFMDTRIHYDDTEMNPCTNMVRLMMRSTLFQSGEEVSA